MPLTTIAPFSAGVIRTLAIAVLRRPTALVYTTAILWVDDEILHPRGTEAIPRNHPVYRLADHLLNTLLLNDLRHAHGAQTARVTGVVRIDLPRDAAGRQVELLRVLDDHGNRVCAILRHECRALAQQGVGRLACHAPQGAVGGVYGVGCGYGFFGRGHTRWKILDKRDIGKLARVVHAPLGALHHPGVAASTRGVAWANSVKELLHCVLVF